MNCRAFFRFVAGKPGGAATYMRYVSRPTALREGVHDILLQHLPDVERIASRVAEGITPYTVLRDYLVAFSWLRDLSERHRERETGRPARVYYRALISFGRGTLDAGTPTEAMTLVSNWLTYHLPDVRAAGFLHQDTRNPHLHLWLDARRLSGGKLHLSREQFRSLGTGWNRIYEEHIRRLEREGGAPACSPTAVRYNRFVSTERSFYQRLEHRVSGSYEPYEKHVAGYQRETTDSPSVVARGEPTADRRESLLEPITEDARRAMSAAGGAVSETVRLSEDVIALATREPVETRRNFAGREPGIEQER